MQLSKMHILTRIENYVLWGYGYGYRSIPGWQQQQLPEIESSLIAYFISPT